MQRCNSTQLLFRWAFVYVGAGAFNVVCRAVGNNILMTMMMVHCV